MPFALANVRFSGVKRTSVKVGDKELRLKPARSTIAAGCSVDPAHSAARLNRQNKTAGEFLPQRRME